MFWTLSLVFFLAASAGLMVLSQAAGIIAAYGGAAALAISGTTFIAATIAIARLSGGWMVDWLTIPAVAACAHTVALVGNVALTLWPGPELSVVALMLVGVGYGIISGVTAFVSTPFALAIDFCKLPRWSIAAAAMIPSLFESAFMCFNLPAERDMVLS